MVGTFILTRTFAISALFIGAYDLVYAAPISGNNVTFEDADFELAEARNCRSGGCLRSVPVELVDAPVVREAAPESRSILDDVISSLDAPLGDGACVANGEDTSCTVDLEKREPAPEPKPDDSNCRDGGCS